MPRDPTSLGSAEDWLKRAKSDLSLAKAPKPPDALWEDVCFHAQQAAEKALKAVYRQEDLAFRFTHDLRDLAGTLVERGISVPESVKRAVVLNDYAVVLRYPGVSEPVDEDDWLDAVQLAEAVVSWAERWVRPDGIV